MLAAVYRGPDDIVLEERPIPTIGAGDILVKVISAGICGTDLCILHGCGGDLTYLLVNGLVKQPASRRDASRPKPVL
jgi:threonine dehydrogenase-like Zn-dependent dehydrogenase